MPKPALRSSCVLCDRPMVNGERACAPGHVRHKSRGMCQGCHSDARRDGRLDEHPRNRRPLAETIEAWEMLKMLGYGKAEAASKLGISAGGLRLAIRRWAAQQEELQPEVVLVQPMAAQRQVSRSDHGDAVAA